MIISILVMFWALIIVYVLLSVYQRMFVPAIVSLVVFLAFNVVLLTFDTHNYNQKLENYNQHRHIIAETKRQNTPAGVILEVTYPNDKVIQYCLPEKTSISFKSTVFNNLKDNDAEEEISIRIYAIYTLEGLEFLRQNKPLPQEMEYPM